MIDTYELKDYMARRTDNKLSLAETLDRMRSRIKSIGFCTKVINHEYDDLFDFDARELSRQCMEWDMIELYYYQRCIELGNYKEVNPYAD